jgi:hypothetical protein
MAEVWLPPEGSRSVGLAHDRATSIENARTTVASTSGVALERRAPFIIGTPAGTRALSATLALSGP